MLLDCACLYLLSCLSESTPLDLHLFENEPLPQSITEYDKALKILETMFGEGHDYCKSVINKRVRVLKRLDQFNEFGDPRVRQSAVKNPPVLQKEGQHAQAQPDSPPAEDEMTRNKSGNNDLQLPLCGVPWASTSSTVGVAGSASSSSSLRFNSDQQRLEGDDRSSKNRGTNKSGGQSDAAGTSSDDDLPEEGIASDDEDLDVDSDELLGDNEGQNATNSSDEEAEAATEEEESEEEEDPIGPPRIRYSSSRTGGPSPSREGVLDQT